jgi:hypothetical protein
MTRTRFRPALLLVALTLVVGLPLAGKWARRGGRARCALDGLAVEPSCAVRVEGQPDGARRYCCIDCARRGLARQAARGGRVYVTDEAGGGEVDAVSAWFVRSRVVTNPVTGNRVHAFGRRADAEEHVRVFGGWLLTGGERPFEADAGSAH